MSLGKEVAYQLCRERVEAVCAGEKDIIAKMASIAAILHRGSLGFSWTGFYRVVEGSLVIGPYQGPVGCLRIEFGKGVCGTAAATGETQVVPDVHAFPGHIACDPESRSEIVVPVRGQNGELMAVLDVDATVKEHFDESDRSYLEEIVGLAFGAVETP